jgi:hypothetical protein
MEIKKVLPYVGLVSLLLAGAAGYADLRVELEELKDIKRLEARQSLHWAIMMSTHEELQALRASVGPPEPWSVHLAHCQESVIPR